MQCDMETLPFRLSGRDIILDDIVTNNYVSINNEDFYAGLLDINFKRNKGAHSFVFALYDAQSYDENAIPVYALKISNAHDELIDGNVVVSWPNKAFYSEIECLKKCNANSARNVVSLICDGKFLYHRDPDEQRKRKEINKVFPYYVMEYADCDLKKFMEGNRDKLTYEQKVGFCLQLAQGLNDLSKMGYYHRDLKPDNIFIFGDSWKIGDLGMVATREMDNYDGNTTIIGPKGWLSPEPMNKYLTHGVIDGIDCSIDTSSDIFQLGKIFWYIMQGNVPIGVIHRKDFKDSHMAMYKIIMHMIQYDKNKRALNLEKDVINKLENILK